MEFKNLFVFDIETVGLLPDISRRLAEGVAPEDILHAFSFGYKDLSTGRWKVDTTRNFKALQRLLGNPENTIVGHNITLYDIPALKLLGFDVKARIIDTLLLSWYLYPEKQSHGLKAWGELFDSEKVYIEDDYWDAEVKDEQFYTNMKERCEQDVRINVRLFLMQMDYLYNLYEGNDELIRGLINYLNLKGSVLSMQQDNPLLIDISKAEENLKKLEELALEKEQELNEMLPPVPVKVKRTKPKNLYKKDGSLSAAGVRWKKLTDGIGVDVEYDGKIEEVVSLDKPNSNSSQQIKDFLFSLGWKPTIFKPGANGDVPQISDDDKNLCPDIKRLFSVEPRLENIEGLSVINHRSNYLKAFLKTVDDNGFIPAGAASFTKTLRLIHRYPILNLPKPSAPYGEYVRSCIIAPPGYKFIGADLSGLENRTMQICIYDLDPGYVEEMNSEHYDPHLALALTAGFVNQKEVDFYQWYKNKDKQDNPFRKPDGLDGVDLHAQFERIDKIRQTSKTGNYMFVYGGGVSKAQETLGISNKEAKELHAGYWKKNRAVKEFSNNSKVKTVQGVNWFRFHKKAGGVKQVDETTWIWNPFTRKWLYLSSDKDRFSAQNQENGSYIFDLWCYFLMKAGVIIQAQFHDEFLGLCLEDEIPQTVEKIKWAIQMVNKHIDTPVEIAFDYKVGVNYAEVH